MHGGARGGKGGILWRVYLPITLLDLILGGIRLDHQEVVQLGFFDHVCSQGSVVEVGGPKLGVVGEAGCRREAQSRNGGKGRKSNCE